KECQQKDWIQHKFECKIYKKKFDQLYAIGKSDDLYFRFVLRLYLYLKHNSEIFYERHKLLNDENSAVCLDDIIKQNFPSKYDPMNFCRFTYMRERFLLLKIEYDPVRIALCHKIFRVYGIEIFNYEMKEIGLGLYIAESQLKHSCLSNAKTLFNGSQIVMRATSPIKSGEQITVNNFTFFKAMLLFESWTESIMFNNFSYICKECVIENQIHSMREFLQLGSQIMSVDLEFDLEEKYRICEKFLSMINEFCSECHLGLILHKILMLDIYVNIHDDAKELSAAELAKQLKITLPAVYNEIFENIYFNREEEADVTVMKALANIEFNVKN
uniref:Uncharacterized protein LOC113796867 n=1 Tax=Dermatophagoides pteronyssinus TaxID=6956 RepID=A0A6P6YDJ2_DERPT